MTTGLHRGRSPGETASTRTSSCRAASDSPGWSRGNETPPRRSCMFAIKVEVIDPGVTTFTFREQKTMYGGKRIAAGDTIFIFASENEGGPGLIASGIVTSAGATPRRPGIARQTPRVSIAVRRTALAKRRLGRSELKRFSNWSDG